MTDSLLDNLNETSENLFPELTQESPAVQDISDDKPNAERLTAVYDIPVHISAVLGRSTMPVHQFLKLTKGSIVELDKKIGDAIDIYVNNKLVARGEIIVVDEHLGVTMTEIIKSDHS